MEEEESFFDQLKDEIEQKKRGFWYTMDEEIQDNFREYIESMSWEVDASLEIEKFDHIENVFTSFNEKFTVIKDRLEMVFNYVSQNFLSIKSESIIKTIFQDFRVSVPFPYIANLLYYARFLQKLYSVIIKGDINENVFESAIPIIKKMSTKEIETIANKIKDSELLKKYYYTIQDKSINIDDFDISL